MPGKGAVDSRYSHSDGGTFALTVTGTPASLAADVLATGFGGDQTVWKSFFGAVYPKVPESALIQITAGAAAVAALGLTPFGRRAYAQDAPLGVANRRVGFGSDAANQLRLSAQLSRNPGSTKVFVDHGPTDQRAQEGFRSGGGAPGFERKARTAALQ